MTYENGGTSQPGAAQASLEKINKYAKSLCRAFDELLEFDLTTGRYQLLYTVPGKYVITEAEGETLPMFAEFSEKAVHPDDRAAFLAFFQLEKQKAAAHCGRGGTQLEFRRRECSGTYRWIEATLLPAEEGADNIMICYILDISGRKQAESDSAMLRDIFSAAVENDYQAACLINEETGSYRMYFDKGLHYQFPQGGDYANLVQILEKQIYGPDRPFFKENMCLEGLLRRMKRGNQSIQFRTLVHGVPRWTECRITYFRGGPPLILSTLRDVHESHLATERAHSLSEKYLQSFGRIYANILDVDLVRGRAEILKSKQYPEFNGKTVSYRRIFHKYLNEVIHEADRPLVQRDFSLDSLQDFQRSGQTQKTLEVRWLKETQNYVWAELSVSAIPGRKDEDAGVLVSVRNINEQRLLRSIVDRFVYSNCDYFLYLDAAHDSYVMFSGSDSGTPLPPPSSDSFSKVLNECADAYVVPEDRDRVKQEMKLETVVAALENSPEHILYYGLLDPKLGVTRKRIQFTYYDKPNHMILLTRTDVTHMYNEEQRKNELLRHALDDAKAGSLAKTEFLSRMSHDIRTPMNAILGMTAIAAAQVSDREKILDCLAKINTSSHYLMALLGDILDMSKIESGKVDISWEPFDFTHLLGDISAMASPQATENNLHLSIAADHSVARRYTGDMVRMSQILMNLLSNSMKFTPPGGSISLEMKELSRSGGTAWLQFCISDTGRGMSEEFMKKLYLPFEQENTDVARDHAGSGLGLSIVHNLVQLMGGTIHAQSKQGEGTTFTLTLPLGTAQAAEDDSPSPGAAFPAFPAIHAGADGKPFHGERVLLVEDNALNTEIAKSLLEMDGLVVDTAGDGQEALLLFEDAPAGMYAAILMDIRMPVMDGLAATRAIRALKKADAASVPVIAMSAGAFTEDVNDALSAGMNDYLTKPVETETLRAALKKHLYAARRSL